MAHSFSRGIDAARIGACFMVVLLHVAAIEFHEFDERWWASNFYDSFSRACVPVFLMITGVLLLGRQESLPVFFAKRFMRVMPPLVFWSVFYLLWYHHQGETYGGLWAGLKTMLSGPIAFHLWYLYAIVGIYLFLPLMRRIWQGATQAEKQLYLTAWLCVSGWSLIENSAVRHADILNTYELGSFFGLSGYLFLGAYLHERVAPYVDRPAYWWASAALFVFSSTATMVATWQYSVYRGQPDPLFYDYLSPLVAMAAIGVFNIFYGAGVLLGNSARLSARAWGVISRLAACTLGIYCIHIFVLDLFKSHVTALQGGASAWWLIPVAAVMVFAVAWGLVSVLRRVRPLRHLM